MKVVVTATLSFDRDFNTQMLSRSHRVHLQEIRYFATLGGAGTNLVRVYLRKNAQVGIGSNTETQIFGEVSVTGTATSIMFANGLGEITGQDGDEIVCRLADGTSLADAGLSFRAIGILE